MYYFYPGNMLHTSHYLSHFILTAAFQGILFSLSKCEIRGLRSHSQLRKRASFKTKCCQIARFFLLHTVAILPLFFLILNTFIPQIHDCLNKLFCGVYKLSLNKVTLSLGLPWTPLVYACCLGEVINNTVFHSQNCPSLEGKLYGHPLFELVDHTAYSDASW